MTDAPMDRLTYASPEWIALMRQTLRDLAGENPADLEGVDFTMCEVIRDAPPAGGVVILAARFQGAELTFFDEAVEADVLVRGDYEAMLPGARLAHRTATPEQLAEQAARRRALVEAGRLSSSGDMSKAPRPLLRILSRMHDRMAARTL